MSSIIGIVGFDGCRICRDFWFRIDVVASGRSGLRCGSVTNVRLRRRIALG